ncbi:MAG: hypothetical protein QXH03_00440 [Candidatus Bathyarchaeia archaeon]
MGTQKKPFKLGKRGWWGNRRNLGDGGVEEGTGFLPDSTILVCGGYEVKKVFPEGINICNFFNPPDPFCGVGGKDQTIIFRENFPKFHFLPLLSSPLR